MKQILKRTLPSLRRPTSTSFLYASIWIALVAIPGALTHCEGSLELGRPQLMDLMGTNNLEHFDSSWYVLEQGSGASSEVVVREVVLVLDWERLCEAQNGSQRSTLIPEREKEPTEVSTSRMGWLMISLAASKSRTT